MKKLLAFLLTFALLAPAAFASADLAEETDDTYNYNWEDFAETIAEAGIDGDFYQIPISDVTMAIWVPDLFEPIELAQEYIDQNFISAFGTSGNAATIAVQRLSLTMSLEDFAALLPDYGASNVTNLVINGMPAVGYTQEKNDSMTVSFMPEPECLVEYTFWPLSDENLETIWECVIASIQLAGEDEYLIEYNWDDIAEEISEMGIDAEFRPINMGDFTMTLWLPNALEAQELTQEYIDQHYVAAFADVDWTATVGIQYISLTNPLTLEDFKASLPSFGATEIVDILVNGMPAVCYVIAEQDSGTVTFQPDPGCLVEYTFWPLSVDGASEAWEYVTASIQMAD